jgi:hypothetical protein
VHGKKIAQYQILKLRAALRPVWLPFPEAAAIVLLADAPEEGARKKGQAKGGYRKQQPMLHLVGQTQAEKNP